VSELMGLLGQIFNQAGALRNFLNVFTRHKRRRCGRKGERSKLLSKRPLTPQRRGRFKVPDALIASLFDPD
jgi:hypothetical protein